MSNLGYSGINEYEFFTSGEMSFFEDMWEREEKLSVWKDLQREADEEAEAEREHEALVEKLIADGYLKEENRDNRQEIECARIEMEATEEEAYIEWRNALDEGRI